jgi:hypothetical protein
MKAVKIISDIINVILVVSFIAAVLLILSPFIFVLIVTNLIETCKNKSKLKSLLKANNNKIYFLYSDYNNFEFQNYLKKEHSEIECLNINNISYDDLLLNFLVKGSGNQAFPRIVKIYNTEVITKVHFGSFKHFYKRKNDINTFFDLIEKSIINLNK